MKTGHQEVQKIAQSGHTEITNQQPIHNLFCSRDKNHKNQGRMTRRKKKKKFSRKIPSRFPDWKISFSIY